MFEEGFLVYGALNCLYNKRMIGFTDSFYQYIKFGLTHKVHTVARNACNCLSEIMTYDCGDSLLDKIEDFTPILLDNLTSGDIDRRVKVRTIPTLSEVYDLHSPDFTNYIGSMLDLFSQAAMRCIEVDPATVDSDTYDYVLKLQNVLIESYTVIIQSLEEGNDKYIDTAKVKVGDHLGTIIDFLINSSKNEYRPSLDRIVEIAGLIGDLGRLVPESSGNLFANKTILEMYDYLSKADDKDAQ